jgi:chromosome segregation ATPase
MLEDHAEFKDACQDLETRIDEISDDLRKLPTDYKMIGQYSDIDKEISEVSEWYEAKRHELHTFLEKYKLERELMDMKISRIDTDLKHLNNDVQNLKLQVFSHDQHGGSYSRLSEYLHR